MSLPTLADIKNWSPDVEKKITTDWQKAEPFKFNEKTKKTIYSIDTPPPYVNTPIHMGHAITYSYMDMFARYKRMTGHEVLFPLGLDRNGLPIEVAAEKKFDISPFKVGRQKFIELCEKLLSEASAQSTDSFAQLGISFNSYKKGKEIGEIYHTDDPDYRSLTQATFIRLFKEGRIYEDKRICNWDPRLRTTIADSEIEYKEVPSTFNHIQFKVKETGKNIIIATTRPELIAACGMIIFEPGDERYESLEGKTAISPLYGKEIPIGEHPFAKKEKGSGLVMMCSAGDITDIQFFREQNLKPTILIEKDGTMNEKAGMLQGLSVKQARLKVLEELHRERLIVKQENIVHRTPTSERSKAEIEFIEMPEFYLKQLEIQDKIKKEAAAMNFFPPESRQILDAWIDSISIDWPISRRRFYATPIPLWHAGEYTAVPEEGVYYQAWKEDPPKNAEVFHKGTFVGRLSDKQFKKLEWKGDERVLDTWFDSSISELNLLQYKKNPAFFKKAFPTSLRPQGKEIVRTWLYYTLLRSVLETNKAPFKDVWIHQHILDDKGRKMSKSLGNVIDPQEILKQEGAEALRLWSVTEGDIAKGDLMCSRERIKAELKTITKLVNLTKFITQFKRPKKATATETDKLFLGYMEQLAELTREKYEVYDFHEPAVKLRHFLWELFASHYVEMVKARVYNESKKFSEKESEAARHTLYTLLDHLVLLLHPIIPQVTTIIAQEIGTDLETFPDKKAQKQPFLTTIEKIMQFNSEVWKTKRENNISLKEPIKGIAIPKELSSYKEDLIACHNLI